MRYGPNIAEGIFIASGSRSALLPEPPGGAVTLRCGLRVSEPLNVLVRGQDLAGVRVVIRGAKGGKARVVGLPSSLVGPLAEELETAREVWTCALNNRVPIALPHSLARKYPAYQYSWPWAWVFPARGWTSRASPKLASKVPGSLSSE